jgi:hypothetical protein
VGIDYDTRYSAYKKRVRKLGSNTTCLQTSETLVHGIRISQHEPNSLISMSCKIQCFFLPTELMWDKNRC